MPIAAYYLSKMRYLLRHYHNFDSYEVVLNNLSTSYFYRGSIFYTVEIMYEGSKRNVNTNPYFSNFLFSKFSINDFNNTKVVGLYDVNKDKFYIVKKV